MKRSPLELSVETRTCALLEDYFGFDCLKLGNEGWPDRIIFVGFRRHWFIEFKKIGGKLRPVQERRIERLRKRGEYVLVLDRVPSLNILRDHVAQAQRDVRLSKAGG